MKNKFIKSISGSSGMPIMQALVILAVVMLLVLAFIKFGASLTDFGQRSGNAVISGKFRF